MIRRYTLIGVSGEEVLAKEVWGCSTVHILCFYSGETVIGNVRFSEEFIQIRSLFVLNHFQCVHVVCYLLVYVGAEVTICARG